MAFKMKGNPYKMGKMATKSSMKMAKEAMKMKKEAMAKMKDESAMKLKTSYKMKEAMAKMKDKSAMKAKGDDAVGPKGSATIPSHIREVYPKLTNEAYNKDKSFYDKASRAVIANKQKESPKKMKSPVKAAKPDFPDIDGDGNTKESMKQAAADKKSGAKMKKKEPMTMKKEAMKMKKGEAMKMKKEAMKMKKGEAMKMKKKKSPMEQGKTAPKDKLKAFVSAFDADSNISDTYGRYKAAKATARKKAASKKAKKAPLKQSKNKKRKLSVMDKLSAASRAVSTSEGPFGDSKFMDRYRAAKAGIRKTGVRPKDALMGSNR